MASQTSVSRTGCSSAFTWHLWWLPILQQQPLVRTSGHKGRHFIMFHGSSLEKHQFLQLPSSQNRHGAKSAPCRPSAEPQGIRQLAPPTDNIIASRMKCHWCPTLLWYGLPNHPNQIISPLGRPWILAAYHSISTIWIHLRPQQCRAPWDISRTESHETSRRVHPQRSHRHLLPRHRPWRVGVWAWHQRVGILESAESDGEWRWQVPGFHVETCWTRI